MSQVLTPGERPDAWGLIGDLKRRVAILEAVPPDSGSCVPKAPWSDYGSTGLDIPMSSTGGCASIGSPASATFDGIVKGCSDADATLETEMITGSLTITSITPGTVDTSGCSPGDDIVFHYGFLPPFWQASETIDPNVPFGFGVTRQASTGTVLPAYLVYDLQGWSVLVPGTDALTGIRGNNCARPPIGDFDGYPWTYETLDTLFKGTFLYFIEFGD